MTVKQSVQLPGQAGIDLATKSRELAELQNKNLNQTAGLNTLRILGATLGIGIGARGLYGLAQQIKRKPTPALRGSVAVPIPVESADSEKQAWDPIGNIMSGVSDLAGYVKNAPSNAVGAIGDAVGGVISNPTKLLPSGIQKAIKDAPANTEKFVGGHSATTAEGLPWAIPAYGVAAAGGLGAGYKLTDWLLDKRRKAERDAELQRAERDYNDALFGKTSEAIDELYTQYVEKQADSEPNPATIGNIGGMALGLSLLAGAGIGAGGFSIGKSIADSKSRRKILEAAQAKRRRQLYEASPTPLFAVPEEV